VFLLSFLSQVEIILQLHSFTSFKSQDYLDFENQWGTGILILSSERRYFLLGVYKEVERGSQL
jgi:hypothetical protein